MKKKVIDIVIVVLVIVWVVVTFTILEAKMFDPSREKNGLEVSIPRAQQLQKRSGLLIYWRPIEELPENQQYAIVWKVGK